MPKKIKKVAKVTKAVKKPAKKTSVKKPTEHRPKKKAEVMVVKPREQEFFVASEYEDDKQIEAELSGQVIESLVYSFPQEGKTVTGLSVAGVNETVRKLNRKKNSGYKVRIIPESIKIERDVDMEGEKGVLVTVVAENQETGDTGIGIKFEAYQKTKRDGKKYANTFAIEKAVSKAERNAKRKLIPENVVVDMIKTFLQASKVQQIEQPKTFPVQVIAATPRQAPIDYVEKLKKRLYSLGARTPDEAYDKLCDRTGYSIDLKTITQEQARKCLEAMI